MWISVTNGETVGLGTEDLADVLVNDDGSAVAVSPTSSFVDGVSVPEQELSVLSLSFSGSSTVLTVPLSQGKAARAAFVSGSAQEPVVLVVYEPSSAGEVWRSLFTVAGGAFREESGGVLAAPDESVRAYAFEPQGWEHRGSDLVSGHTHGDYVGVTRLSFPATPAAPLRTSMCEPTFPKKYSVESMTLDRNVVAVFLHRDGAPYLGLVNLDECTIPLFPYPSIGRCCRGGRGGGGGEWAVRH